MQDPFEALDIRVVTVVYDKEEGKISIDFDEETMDNIYVYGLLTWALDIQSELLNGVHEEDEEDD